MTRGFTALEPASFPWLDYGRYTFSLGLERDGVALLAGQVSSAFDDEQGKVVVVGDDDIAAQSDVAWDKVRATLQAGGLSDADVRRIVQYVPFGHLAELQDPRVLVPADVPADAAVTVMPVDRLLRRQVLIEIEVVAARSADGALPPLAERILGRTVSATVDVPRREDLPTARRAAWDRCTAELEQAGLRPEHATRRRETYIGIPPGAVQDDDDRAGGACSRLFLDPDASASVRVDVTAHAGAIQREAGARIHDVTVDDVTHLQVAAPAGSALEDGARAVYEHLVEVADRVDGQIVKTVEFVALPVLRDYRATAELRRELLSEPWPAATGLVCTAVQDADTPLMVEATLVRRPR